MLGWSGDGDRPAIGFGYINAVTGRPVTSVQNFGAYFSTAPGAVLTMTVYNDAVKYHSPIGSIQIGGTGESWDNRYIEVDSPTGAINSVGFDAVSSGALSGFCLDNLTVTPRPRTLPPSPPSSAAWWEREGSCGQAEAAGRARENVRYARLRHTVFRPNCRPFVRICRQGLHRHF